MTRLHIPLVVAIAITFCPILRAEVPTTQPFTLYSVPPRDPKQEDLDRLLDQLSKLRGERDALKNALPQLAPEVRNFNLNLKPLPANSKPTGPIEQWAGSTRPALFHITPNVVETSPGHYTLHRDTPQVIRGYELIPMRETIGAYNRNQAPDRDLDLIDDRPKQAR
jgi:hypothetical protein